MGAFGEKLRKQREQRGIALDAISNTTKISTRMLRALEDEHFDQLPGGVFNKGFVRAYARQIGLDEEEAITDYLAALRESQIQQHAILPDFRTPAGKSRPAGATDLRSQEVTSRHHPPNDVIKGSQEPREEVHGKKENRPRDEDLSPSQHSTSPHSTSPRSTIHPESHPPAGRSSSPEESPAQAAGDASVRIPWGTLAAALLVITLLLAFWNFRRHRDATAASNAPSVETPSVGTKSAGTLSSGTVSTALGPAPTLPGAPPSSKTTASSTTSTSLPAPAAGKPAATTTNPLAAKKNPAAAKAPSTFTLLIRAEKTSWVSIVADGKPVAEETLIAPAHTSVRASHEIYVRAGNAAGVSFLLNGKEFPAQGSDGEVKTYIFDATGVRVEPQPAPNR